MKSKLKIFGLLLMVLSLGLALLPSTAEAAPVQPGCYILTGAGAGRQFLADTNCTAAKVGNTSFNPSPTGCYYRQGPGPLYGELYQINACETESGQTAVKDGKSPIPAGCPGSPLQGDANKGVCGSIPAGCPGSTQQGVPAPGVNCPYGPSQTSLPDPGAGTDQNQGGSGGNGQANTNTPTPATTNNTPLAGDKPPTTEVCGAAPNQVGISIKVGCRGQGNPIVDMLFAFIRFLSVGVGIVLVASTIVAGIQYTASSGDPNALSQAKGRIASNLGALVLFLLIYAILNWLVPGGMFFP